MMAHSLRARLLLATALVVPVFLGLTGLVIDQAFQKSMEASLRERLETQIYALLAAAETDALGRMRLPYVLPEPRFSTPDSGLYALVGGEQGAYQWHSQSQLGRNANFLESLSINQFHFRHFNDSSGLLYVLSYAVLWEDDSGKEIHYDLAVAEDATVMLGGIRAFRLTLWIGLGVAAVLLLGIEWGLLHWGLMPLRRAAADIARIERGEQQRLQGEYPAELLGLTRNLNTLLDFSQAERERYRNSLGDLAHSLKTPLAVMQNAADDDSPESILAVLQEQLPRMNRIVQYQLQRASGPVAPLIGHSIAILGVTQKIVSALNKVYFDKEINCEIHISPDCQFNGDEADLMEVLGNVLDNAYKYGRSQVRISAKCPVETGQETVIQIDDDGQGIAADQVEILLRRGERADQKEPGQGIGLAVTAEIIQVYQGTLEIETSDLGGTRVFIGFRV